jgi:hypothetical protein
MKKNRDEPIGVIIYIYTEMSQKTPCIATFILNKQKCHLFSFFIYKIGEQEGGTDPAQGGRGLISVGGGRWQGKEVGG